jgi:hypothetical protein
MRHKEGERKKAETERKRQRQRFGHMQGMGSPACVIYDKLSEQIYTV